MSAWRRNAIKLFPEYKTFLNSKDENLAQFLLEVGSDFDKAIETQDELFLSKMFSYAEWCLRNCGEDVENQLISYFYKDVFLFKQKEWEYLLRWVSPWVFSKISWYLEAKLPPERLVQAKRVLGSSVLHHLGKS